MMIKRIKITAIFSAVVLLALFTVSCSGNSTDTGSPQTDDLLSSLWEGADGVEINENGIVSSANEYTTVISKRAAPNNFSACTTLDMSKNSSFKLIFEAEFDEDKQLKNGYAISLDPRTRTFNAYLYTDGSPKPLATYSIAFTEDTEFFLTFDRKRPYIDAKLYSSDKETQIAALSLSEINLKGTDLALELYGKTTVRDFDLCEYDDQSTTLYTNPVLSTGSDLGDPTVFYEDGKYYLLTTGSFECYESVDLVNFNSIGTIADKNTLYGHTYFGGASLFKHDDLYYLFYTSYAPNTNSTIMCVATANNVKGPYTQTKQTVVDSVACPEASAGAFAFKAPGGKTYLYWYQTVKDTGNTIFGAEAEFENGVVKIKHETKKILITPSDSWEMKNEYGVGGKVCERPNVYFHNGYYYLFYAGSHWKTSYGQGYATSISPLGDFEKDKSNPILRSSSSIGGVGCTYVVPSPSGEELYVVYHAHKRVGVPSPRNVCIDKLIFIDNPNGPDHARILGPTVTPQAYK